ncbi:MAG TPA: hypothetical protein VIF37_06400 [Methylobacter sp.]|jgi:hypothetical protein
MINSDYKDYIKVKGGVALPGEPVPQCLIGLPAELLADLSWLPAEVNAEQHLEGCAWWSQEILEPVIDEMTQKAGSATFIPDLARKVVVVSYPILTLTPEEAAAKHRELNSVPESVKMAQARLALLQRDLLDDVNSKVATMPRAAQIEWEYETVVRRDNSLVIAMQSMLSMTDAQMDDLFVLANKQ